MCQNGKWTVVLRGHDIVSTTTRCPPSCTYRARIFSGQMDRSLTALLSFEAVGAPPSVSALVCFRLCPLCPSDPVVQVPSAAGNIVEDVVGRRIGGTGGKAQLEPARCRHALFTIHLLLYRCGSSMVYKLTSCPPARESRTATLRAASSSRVRDQP